MADGAGNRPGRRVPAPGKPGERPFRLAPGPRANRLRNGPAAPHADPHELYELGKRHRERDDRNQTDDDDHRPTLVDDKPNRSEIDMGAQLLQAHGTFPESRNRCQPTRLSATRRAVQDTPAHRSNRFAARTDQPRTRAHASPATVTLTSERGADKGKRLDCQ